MKVIADLCVVPLGVGLSVSEYVAACQRVLSEAGLETHLHAYGTNIEGEWETVFDAVRRCHEVIHEMGAPRISTTLKFGTRTDREQTMEEKVTSVEGKMGNGDPPRTSFDAYGTTIQVPHRRGRDDGIGGGSASLEGD